MSHSPTESGVISLDADQGDVVIEVKHSSKNTHAHQAVTNHCRGEIRSTNPETKLKRSGNRG